MAHIPEYELAQLEAMLAVATESWRERKEITPPVSMFLDLAVKQLPEMINGIREYNEALRVTYTAMKRNNWHRIKDGRGLVPEPLTAEDAYTLVSSALGNPDG